MAWPLKDDFKAGAPVSQIPTDWLNTVARILNTLSGDGCRIVKTPVPGPAAPWLVRVTAAAGTHGADLSDATPQFDGDAGLQGDPGTSVEAARADHIHPANLPFSPDLAIFPTPVGLNAAIGNSMVYARADHVHAMSQDVADIFFDYTDGAFAYLDADIDTLFDTTTTLWGEIYDIGLEVAELTYWASNADADIDTLWDWVEIFDTDLDTLFSNYTTLNTWATTANSNINTLWSWAQGADGDLDTLFNWQSDVNSWSTNVNSWITQANTDFNTLANNDNNLYAWANNANTRINNIDYDLTQLYNRWRGGWFG